MGENEENFGMAASAAGAIGSVAAAAAGVAAAPVVAAGAVGAAIGTGLEVLTDGAISDTLSDGLLSLVGEEESYEAAMAFDDGEYFEAAGHMLSGAGSTIYDAAGDAVEAVGDFASDAYDAAGDAVDAVGDFIGDLF
ncbi:MAG: hypothetical protein ABWZ26_05745 [Candidatus Nanopelagicales bacterium]